jgi:hypothetical protein
METTWLTVVNPHYYGSIFVQSPNGANNRLLIRKMHDNFTRQARIILPGDADALSKDENPIQNEAREGHQQRVRMLCQFRVFCTNRFLDSTSRA